MRNLTTEILGKGCKNVVIEPLLAPLTGAEFPKSSNTSNQARADVPARGLWINRQTVFCDIRVFNPLARCEKNEGEKKWEYIILSIIEQLLPVEHRSFTPLPFSCFGGVSRECSRFFSHTAERFPNRRKEPKNKIRTWKKARLNFALTRSMLLCLRGTRTSLNFNNIIEIDLCVIVADSKF